MTGGAWAGVVVLAAGCSFRLDHPPPYHPQQAQPVLCEESRVRPILDTWGAAASAYSVGSAATCDEGEDCLADLIILPVAVITGIVFTWAAVRGYGMTHECRCAHAAWEAAHPTPPLLQTPAGTIQRPTVPCDQLRANYRAASDPEKRFELARQIRAYCRERPSAPAQSPGGPGVPP